MVELQIVILAVAGSSPVGHPIFKEKRGSMALILPRRSVLLKLPLGVRCAQWASDFHEPA